MKKVILLIFIASFSGMIGGCSLFGNKSDDTATTQETPTPKASPSPSPTDAQPFGQTPPSGGGSSSNIDVAGLIPSTPPSEIPVEKGRSNPFAVVPVKPIITVDPTKLPTTPPPPTSSSAPTASAPRPNPNPARPSGSPNTAVAPRTPGTPPTPPSSRASGNVPTPQAQPPAAKAPIAPPPPPQPTEAEAVFVSGVVGLPTRPVAIIKAPGERVERTVTPGSLLANGQVRVKAIYAYSENPIVILEQHGIEVAKKVGEAPVEAKAPETEDNG